MRLVFAGSPAAAVPSLTALADGPHEIVAVLTRDDIVESPIVVLNKGGGSGAEAFLYARQNEGDPHKLIFGTNNVYLLPHVAKLAYSVEDLQPVAALALDEFLVWVKADSHTRPSPIW